MSASLSLIIYSAVKPIFKIYAIMIIGYYLSKKNILTVSTCRDISDLIVSAIFPSLIFNNIVSNLKSSDIKNIGIIVFTAVLLFLIGSLLALVTYYTTKSPKKWMGGLVSVGLFPNISDLPIAYLQTLSKGSLIFTTDEGNRGVALICIFVLAQIFFQFSLGLYKLVEWDFRDELITPQSSSDAERKVGDDQEKIIIDLPNERNNLPDSTSVDLPDEANLLNSSLLQVEPEPIPLSLKSSLSSSIASSHEQTSQHSHFLRHYIHKTATNLTNNSLATQHSQTHGNILQMVPSKVTESRAQKSESINDVINQFSDYDHHRKLEDETASLERVVSVKTIVNKTKSRLVGIVKNFMSPNSLALIIGIAVAMAPPLKALFVSVKSPHIPSAPDNQPPLSFIIDITSYLGQASVPLGLLLLGATISRLQVKNMPPGFWKTASMITVSRLMIMPIFGVGLTTGLYKAGWYGEDQLIRFVSVLEFGVPSATSLVYFTAFYTDPNSDTHLQMDCLAVCLIFQYLILFITLPFLVTFTLKVSLGK